MAGILKTTVRFGVISGLVAGGAILVAGPERVSALVRQAHHNVVEVIDNNIDDPIAMRAQLRDLEAQYPRKIAEVRSHVAELETQMAHIDRERKIAQRVVELATTDHLDLQQLLARAEDAQSENAYRVVRINFQNRQLDVDDAYRRATNISSTIDSYQARVDDYTLEFDSLQLESETLHELLGKLETEHADFQMQLAQLERQIDAVARKERMVKMLAERQRRMDEISRYRVASLDQFTMKVNSKLAELDSEIAQRSARGDYKDYVSKAQTQIDRQTAAEARSGNSQTLKPTREVIEIGPSDKEELEAAEEQFARSGPIVIN